MELAIADHFVSGEDYLQGELASVIRHEYVAGNVYAKSGGTLNHQRIAGNFTRIAGNQLTEKPCFPTGCDFKLQVPLGRGEEAFYYPDGMIICVPVPGNALFTDSPSVILEVRRPAASTKFRSSAINLARRSRNQKETDVVVSLYERAAFDRTIRQGNQGHHRML